VSVGAGFCNNLVYEPVTASEIGFKLQNTIKGCDLGSQLSYHVIALLCHLLHFALKAGLNSFDPRLNRLYAFLQVASDLAHFTPRHDETPLSSLSDFCLR
jgi:hypothetical protein